MKNGRTELGTICGLFQSLVTWGPTTHMRLVYNSRLARIYTELNQEVLDQLINTPTSLR
jgi:hypothetical protein